MTLDEFITQVSERPLPENPLTRIRILAKELAEGTLLGMWDINIRTFRGRMIDQDIQIYLDRRWQGSEPHYSLLYRMNYLTEGVTKDDITPTAAAYALVEETEPSTIFISYSRRESSALALLVLERLKSAGLKPFLDLALEPGENWREGLKARVQEREYVLLLLGRTTLESVYVVEELEWALAAQRTILPIWQPGFQYRSADWPSLPSPIDYALTHTHTIRILEENPLEYDKALTELLNRFGMTP